MAEPIFVSTENSKYFAQEIMGQLFKGKFCATHNHRFPDGERYFRLDLVGRMDLFNTDAVIVGSTHCDDDFDEICRVGTAVAKNGARRVIYVIPFFGYSTMERESKPGEIVTAKIVARQLSQLPQGDVRNCFLMLDLHTAGQVHYFEGECLRRELYAESVLISALDDLGLSNFMFGTADLSRVKWARTYARKFNTRFAIVDKERDFETTHVKTVIGDVKGMKVVIYDDMIRSGNSLVQAAEAYLDAGAESVYAVTTHLALTGNKAIDTLECSPLEAVIATNSHPMSQHHNVVDSLKFIVKDVSHIFAEAICKFIQ